MLMVGVIECDTISDANWRSYCKVVADDIGSGRGIRSVSLFLPLPIPRPADSLIYYSPPPLQPKNLYSQRRK